jgi:hypothetical protein
VRSLFTRIAIRLIAVCLACIGVSASFVFFCLAIYAAFSTVLSPTFAAMATGGAFLLVTFFVVAILLTIARKGPRSESPSVATGKAIGAALASLLQSHAEENAKSSLLMSLIAGFFAGRNR